MRLFKNFFSGETVTTLLAVAVTGLIIHGLTDFGFWACAFFGYIGVEGATASTRVETAQLEIRSLNRRIGESQRQIELLWAKLSDLKDELEEAEFSRGEK